MRGASLEEAFLELTVDEDDNDDRGGFVVMLALLGGAFGQLFKGGVMLTIVKLLPSYWLVQAGRTVVGSGSWPAEGWIVVAVWTLCFTPLAAAAYRRDTAPV
ncbi:MAG TPA: hypothetical protein VK425_02205 [Acidimicrobiales bacterium]|nr:hypothetical protein [Acidimicrobiales bacterium]